MCRDHSGHLVALDISTLFKQLYLYLVIGTLLNEIIVGLNIEHQWKYKGQETVCVWLGFFSQLTFVLAFILSYEVVAHVFYIAVKGFSLSNVNSLHQSITL